MTWNEGSGIVNTRLVDRQPVIWFFILNFLYNFKRLLVKMILVCAIMCQSFLISGLLLHVIGLTQISMNMQIAGILTKSILSHLAAVKDTFCAVQFTIDFVAL